VALSLMVHGWKNVHPLYGGFDAWRQAGLPLEPK
jgi:3-mercaptopyruvate sulfurtransferase SseA